MASSYTPNLRFTLPVQGELAASWGNTVNTGITSLVDSAISGTVTKSITGLATYALTVASGATDEARSMFVTLTGSPTVGVAVTCQNVSKLYFVTNSTDKAVIFRPTTGSGITIPVGVRMALYCDGTNVVDGANYLSSLTLGAALPATSGGTGQTSYAVGDLVYASTTTALSKLADVATGNALISGGVGVAPSYGKIGLTTHVSGTLPVANGGTGVTTSTGTGSVVLNTSPTLVTPALGTPASGVVTNLTGTASININGTVGATTPSAGAFTTLNASSDATINGLTVGRGPGAIATNAVFGRFTFTSNTTGNNNTAIGGSALYSNNVGNFNTASGNSALYNNTSGSNNVATGVNSLYNNINGNDNVAIGNDALSQNDNGYGNVAIGGSTLSANSSGSYNTAIGHGVLLNNTSGSGNVMLGGRTSSNTYSPVFDPTTQNNRLCMGSTAVTNAYVQVSWTVVSDARDKTDFAPVPHGLDFVTKLKPTAYRYKANRDDSEGHGPVRYGFKAQDVLALEGDTPVIVDAEDLEKLRFNDQSMLAVLVNAIKELKAEFDAYKATHP